MGGGEKVKCYRAAMSELTVKAVLPVLGLNEGDEVTVERTPRVDGAIAAGFLIEVTDQPTQPANPGNVLKAAAAEAESGEPLIDFGEQPDDDDLTFTVTDDKAPKGRK